MHPHSADKKHHATSIKLLLFVIIVLGGSECQIECLLEKETEHLSCFWVSFMHTLCMKDIRAVNC